MPYSHTQRGTSIMVMCLLVLLAASAVTALVRWRASPSGDWGALLSPLVIMAVLAAVAWYFSSMTVEVTDGELRWSLGPGRAYRIDRRDIEGASIVRHPLWHGYGIRWIGPNRWTYIVSGRNAVEVRLKGGGWRRIGTDDPQGLLVALTSG